MQLHTFSFDVNHNHTTTHLSEYESDVSYVRKHKMTSFTAVSSELKKSRLCQIPSDKELEIISFLGTACGSPYIVFISTSGMYTGSL